MATDPVTVASKAIADPTHGPLIERLVHGELGPIAEAIQADDVSARAPVTEDEIVRRALALGSAADRLARLSALAGRWAPPSTARIWPSVLAHLLDVRDRGNGLTPWLQLLAYPALLIEYAFGLGASIGRRYDNLAIILTAPTPDEVKGWQPAVLQLHPGTISDRLAISLAGGERRWPLSTHLLAVTRPWFAEMVASNALFEREFDRFEVTACLVYYDIARGEGERARAPFGRFAGRGRWDVPIHDALVKEGRQDDTASTLLAALASGDHDRLSETWTGFDELVGRVLGQGW